MTMTTFLNVYVVYQLYKKGPRPLKKRTPFESNFKYLCMCIVYVPKLLSNSNPKSLPRGRTSEKNSLQIAPKFSLFFFLSVFLYCFLGHRKPAGGPRLVELYLNILNTVKIWHCDRIYILFILEGYITRHLRRRRVFI